MVAIVDDDIDPVQQLPSRCRPHRSALPAGIARTATAATPSAPLFFNPRRLALRPPWRSLDDGHLVRRAGGEPNTGLRWGANAGGASFAHATAPFGPPALFRMSGSFWVNGTSGPAPGPAADGVGVIIGAGWIANDQDLFEDPGFRRLCPWRRPLRGPQASSSAPATKPLPPSALLHP